MADFNKHDYIFFAGIILWLIETGMFGWHMTSQSVAETMFDTVSALLMIYGFLCGLADSFCRKTTIHLTREDFNRL